VNLTLEKMYALIPTSFVWFEPGSRPPRSTALTEPIASDEFTVCEAPTIGNEPFTVAAVLTERTANE
jgi:hypothetical protein